MITEIDCMSTAGITYPEGIKRHITYGARSKNPDSVVLFMHNTLCSIKHRLENKSDRGIIYWRERPKLQFDEGTEFYFVRFRLLISPDIELELQAYKPEGQEMVEV